MYRFLFFLTLTFFSAYAEAQNLKKAAKNIEAANAKAERKWLGTIVLKDGQELNCKFTYNPLIPGGLLIVKTDSLPMLYAPEKVTYFYFTDSVTNSKKYFYSLPFRAGERDLHFFELIHDSEQISILGSIIIADLNDQRTDTGKLLNYLYSARYPTVNNSNKINSNINYKEFLLDHRDNNIYELSEKEILRMTQDRTNEITAFKKQNSLKLNGKNIEAYIAIVDYYSSLKTKP